MSVKDRIIQYLDNNCISITKAEALLGWSKGALLKANSISSDRLGEFILRFDNINLKWLLTGEGPMLKPDQSTEGVQLSGRSANYQGTFNEPVNTIMGSGNTVGSSARERIAEVKEKKLIEAKKEASELKHENEKLRAENEHLKMTIELQKSFIEEKERMIKILLEKK